MSKFSRARLFGTLGIAASLVALGCGPQPYDATDPGKTDPAPDVERPPVTYHKDGSVTAGQAKFATVQTFQRSEEFHDFGRRCASVKPDTDYAEFAPSDCSFDFTSIEPEYQPDAVFEIPVVFHIIQKTTGEGFVSEDLARSQVDVLNEDYQALVGTNGEPGTNGAIRFVLATVDPDGNPTTGITYETNDEWFTDPGPGAPNDMKEALSWDSSRYLNIYTNDASGALGYATFPSQSAGTTEDGVVLLWTSVGRNAPQGGVYNLGRTATHEIGHYLGLFHTFQDGCGDSGSPYATGDRIADTVAHTSPDFGCTAGTTTCSGGGSLPIENYMDYTDDACMNRFSPEQVNRMRCSLIHYRADLYTVEGGEGENVPPAASFSHTESGLSTSLSDNSSDSDGSVVAWAWDFGDGATSTSQN
ncbi:MAG TPA: zinc metalloprotease, partial [Kofleriaceae bacterium]|nr:zinc metalloprotease [Kofleriaceae bacterium]